MALVQASVNTIEIHCAIGAQTYFTDQYVALGYFNHTTEANRFEVGAVISTGEVTLTSTAGVIRSVQATPVIDSQVGEQSYLEAQDYITVGYFTVSVDSFITTNVFADATLSITAQVSCDTNVIPGTEANLAITSAVTALGTELRSTSATLTSEVTVGEKYIEDNYIEAGYFQEGIPANEIHGAVIASDIAGTVSLLANADFIGDVNITATVTVQASMGTTQVADIDLTIESSANIFASERQAVDATLDIALGTSLTANAELAGDVTVAIQATTSIQANAESTGVITFTGISDLTVNAGVFRDNPRYTLLIPQENRVNTITQETRQVIIPAETRELEFEV